MVGAPWDGTLNNQPYIHLIWVFIGYIISPFTGLLRGVKQLGYHPKGTTIFPMRGFGESNILTCSSLDKISTLPKFNSSPLKSYRAPIGTWFSNHNFFRGYVKLRVMTCPNFGKTVGGCLNWLGSFPVECCGLGSYELMNFFRWECGYGGFVFTQNTYRISSFIIYLYYRVI